MEKLIKIIERQKGGKINVDYEQGLDDCIDIIREYQEEQLKAFREWTRENLDQENIVTKQAIDSYLESL